MNPHDPSSTGQAPATSAQRRTANTDAYIEATLSHLRDEDLPEDVRRFHDEHLPKVDVGRLIRAAMVAKNPKTYQDIAKGLRSSNDPGLVQPKLSDEEKEALREEQESVFSERGMIIVIFTVSLAAFLQGHVQSSINGASLYHDRLGLQCNPTKALNDTSQVVHPGTPTSCDWELGATNATPFLAAAVLGCWLSLPISDRFGRRGSMIVAAVLVFLSSLGSALVLVMPMNLSTPRWTVLLGVRIISGIGMGIKAVNTPILASETAIGYWRGTSILAWQLWVAFGIFLGFGFNILFSFVPNKDFALALILGSPIIASIMLLLALFVCPESPRWYMRNGPKRSPEKAYNILKSLRSCELIAMRDIYLLHKSIEQEELQEQRTSSRPARAVGYNGVGDFCTQFADLFRKQRQRNALISSSIVALAQQLCGVNILAFYSGTLFNHIWSDDPTPTDGKVIADPNNIRRAMYFSIGFGAVNFIFGLPAFRTIDTIGRRKLLTTTLIPMAILMAAAALSFFPMMEDSGSSRNSHITAGLVAFFLYLHTALYSPGLGPIPFTLAAESFPLSHREIGCAFAVSINLFFAGILSVCFPSIVSGLGSPGCLGLFAGFNLVAFILVFLYVEETRRLSLEDLDFIYAVSKRKFCHHQVSKYLPWLVTKYVPYLLSSYRPWRRDGGVDVEGSDGYLRRAPQSPQLYSYEMRSEKDSHGTEVELAEFQLDSDDDRK